MKSTTFKTGDVIKRSPSKSRHKQLSPYGRIVKVLKLRNGDMYEIKWSNYYRSSVFNDTSSIDFLYVKVKKYKIPGIMFKHPELFR